MRLSGAAAHGVAAEICGVTLEPRLARYCRFRDGDDLVDEGIALYFAGPHSFTGEDVVELQGHGGPVVMQKLLDVVCAKGARIARPGEFSERAFHNGKIDLAQAEAVADLIASTSATAARAAINTLQGAFSEKIDALTANLEALRIRVEAAIDFPDEDVEILAEAGVVARLAEIEGKIVDTLAASEQGALLAGGINVAIVGPPNVGKSSLLNALSGEEAAIVTDIPGTTRDLLKVDLVIDGLPIRLVDTAGLRDTDDAVESIGVERARKEAASADLVLRVEDARKADAGERNLDMAPNSLLVLNKLDLLDEVPTDASAAPAIHVSAKTGAGLEELRKKILATVGFTPEHATYTARARHVQSLREAKAFCEEATLALTEGEAAELVAEHLRCAHEKLGAIVGTVSADDLLGKIFSEFCIGK